VINHGFKLDGSGPTQSALYFFILKIFEKKECLTNFFFMRKKIGRGPAYARPLIITCLNLLLGQSRPKPAKAGQSRPKPAKAGQSRPKPLSGLEN